MKIALVGIGGAITSPVFEDCYSRSYTYGERRLAAESIPFSFKNLDVKLSASSLGLFTGPDGQGHQRDVYWVEQPRAGADQLLLCRYQTQDGISSAYGIPTSVGHPHDYAVDKDGKIYLLGETIACFDVRQCEKGIYEPAVDSGAYSRKIHQIVIGPKNDLYGAVMNDQQNMDLIRLRSKNGAFRFVGCDKDVVRGKSVYLFYHPRLREFYGCNWADTTTTSDGEYVAWVWDPFSEEIRRKMVPQRGHCHLQTAYANGSYDLMYLLTAEIPGAPLQVLNTFDMKIRKEFLRPKQVTVGQVLPHGLAANGDGYTYGLTKQGVFRIDAYSGKVSSLATSPAKIERGIVVTSAGVYFQAEGTLWRYRASDWTVYNGALPAWTEKIRRTHPRLFLNADMLEEVRKRALGRDKALFERIRQKVDEAKQKVGEFKEDQSANLGYEAASAAFCYLIMQDQRYLDLTRKFLLITVEHLEKLISQRKDAGWWSKARAHFIMAWDWVYSDLSSKVRTEIMDRFAASLHKIYTAEPAIPGENMAGVRTGFYGVDALKWYVGCATLATESESEHTRRWLFRGYSDHIQMLKHRSVCASDDGGSASSALSYSLIAYPWAEENFYYTWHSSTGENLAHEWPFSSRLAYYIYWNTIPAPDGMLLRYNTADTNHQGMKLATPYSIDYVNTHLSNLRHFYPDTSAAALADRMLGEEPKLNTDAWFIYPFLRASLEDSLPDASLVEKPLLARHFDGMGQIFMRSGTGPADTYGLFTCGGTMTSHRNLDALSFTIYHKGLLALDSGDYHANNNDHRANYFEHTVAHNSILIHQPNEPRIYHWAGEVVGHYGGQHQIIGSEVEAFETNDEFVYVAGDATTCYEHNSPNLPEKAKQVTRQFVFLPPSHFVIFDRVVSTKPSYSKQWLIHTACEPIIGGNSFHADQGQGRLFCRTLLPKDAELRKVGGPGNRFRALGKNWPWDKPGEDQYSKFSESVREIMGQWRVEVAPGAQRREDFFLHVIQVGDQSRGQMDKIVRLETETTYGARITRADGQAWEVTFRKSGPLAGHIRAEGKVNLNQNLTQHVQPQTGMIEFSLQS